VPKIPLGVTYTLAGVHDFEGSKPVFVLTGPPVVRTVAQHVASSPAPVEVQDGRYGEGAVDWLALGNADGGASVGGVRDVYRVETAGGMAEDLDCNYDDNISAWRFRMPGCTDFMCDGVGVGA
jgi:Protein of unknown function (DUF3455)